MSLRRVRPVPHPPRALTVVLAVLLATLSGYAVVANWQQAALLREVAEAGSDTDAYQEAAFALTSEMAILQAIMHEAGAEERDVLLAANQRAESAMTRMADVDSEHHQAAEALADQHGVMRVAVVGFLAQVDRGDRAAATDTLEEVIEPAYTAMMNDLLREQTEHVADYDRKQADSLRDSRTRSSPSWSSSCSA